MGDPWAAHGSSWWYIWLTHELPMGRPWSPVVSGGNPWVSHGSPMDLPWVYGGGPWVCMGLLWGFSAGGCPIGPPRVFSAGPRNSHGTPIGLAHGSAMGLPCVTLGFIYSFCPSVPHGLPWALSGGPWVSHVTPMGL